MLQACEEYKDTSTDWMDELNYMVKKSAHERLHMEGFSRADFNREHNETGPNNK